MTLQERCQTAEARLRALSGTLLEPGPQALDRCEAELKDVIELLAAYRNPRPGASDRAGLVALRAAARSMAVQVRQAANMCDGLVQLHWSTGYTEQGRPALLEGEPQTSYEA
jgi:hypothetical protein